MVIMNGMDEAKAEMEENDLKEKENTTSIAINELESKLAEMQALLATFKNQQTYTTITIDQNNTQIVHSNN